MLPSPSAGRAVRIVPRQDRGALVLAVTGDLDIDNVAPLAAALEGAAADGAAPVVVDLSDVSFADSTTVNVLLQGQTLLGPRLRLAAPSPFVQRLIGVLGLDSVLPVFPTVTEAIEPPLPA
ncbi:STAS domain-containing protein [Streptomyces sp. NBC_01013]|uniref:STAS domain-containing protein n=1 Tax=Streptomyces sp. NBC_01013 TaxID=2903718 RepID=UPI003865D53F|nr:STAS domain-containing protein [Streptomyces sp. NBC_01013]